MIVIDNKEQCCGCTACESACPRKCIKMLPDDEGFLYPNIDSSMCIECGLCEKVCPIKNAYLGNDVLESFAIRSINSDVLSSSTSGGFVTSLMDYIFENDGIVCAVTYSDKFDVEHQIFDKMTSVETLSKVRGSKYVQSNLKGRFNDIKSYLNQNRLVCFIGTPCQVAGLTSFLQKKYTNLITVDLVCHGVLSPKLWNQYVEQKKKDYNSDITNIHFRNKTYGYHSSTMKIEFDNGNDYLGSGRIDPILKSFFAGIASRPSCYACSFKGEHRCGDFTIFNCWHFSALTGNKDDDKGYTNLFINTDEARKYWNKISCKYKFYKTDYSKAIDLDGIMVNNSAKIHKSRAFFYDSVNSFGIDKAINTFIPISKKDFVLEKIKKFLYFIGLMPIIKRIKTVLK